MHKLSILTSEKDVGRKRHTGGDEKLIFTLNRGVFGVMIFVSCLNMLYMYDLLTAILEFKTNARIYTPSAYCMTGNVDKNAPPTADFRHRSRTN